MDAAVAIMSIALEASSRDGQTDCEDVRMCLRVVDSQMTDSFFEFPVILKNLSDDNRRFTAFIIEC